MFFLLFFLSILTDLWLFWPCEFHPWLDQKQNITLFAGSRKSYDQNPQPCFSIWKACENYSCASDNWTQNRIILDLSWKNYIVIISAFLQLGVTFKQQRLTIEIILKAAIDPSLKNAEVQTNQKQTSSRIQQSYKTNVAQKTVILVVLYSVISSMNWCSKSDCQLIV